MERDASRWSRELSERMNTLGGIRHTLEDMRYRSRSGRDTLVRALATIGAVFAVTVLGALFVVMGAHGQDRDGGYTLVAQHTDHGRTANRSDDRPSSWGLGLSLVVLAGGATVLTVGANRKRREEKKAYVEEPEPTDLSLALGLSMLT